MLLVGLRPADVPSAVSSGTYYGFGAVRPTNYSTSTNGESQREGGCFCQERLVRFTGKIPGFPLFCDLGLGDEAMDSSRCCCLGGGGGRGPVVPRLLLTDRIIEY